MNDVKAPQGVFRALREFAKKYKAQFLCMVTFPNEDGEKFLSDGIGSAWDLINRFILFDKKLEVAKIGTARLSFHDENGKSVDIRDEDLSMGIDLVKNAQNRVVLDKEISQKDKEEMLESYFRLYFFLIKIRTGLKPQGH